MRKGIAAAIAAVGGLWGPTAMAADPAVEPAAVEPAALDHAVFGFVGRYTQDTFGRSFNPFVSDFDDLTAVGIGYQGFVADLPLNVRFGYEIGVAGRFGSEDRRKAIPGDTAEFWGGGLLRYDGFSLLDTVHVAASATFGFSAVTESSGYERKRERAKNGDASFLFFLAPEVSLSLESYRQFEVFGRVQHRSGGGGILGDMNEGANAAVAGVRLFF